MTPAASSSRAAPILYAAGLAAAFAAGLLVGRSEPSAPAGSSQARREDPKPAACPASPDLEPIPEPEAQRLLNENRRLAARVQELESSAALAPAVIAPEAAKPKPAPGTPATLQDAVAALRDACAAGDDAEVKRLSGILRQLVGANPEAALEALALLESETDPRVVQALADATKNDAVLGDARVRARVLALFRTHPDRAHKLAALGLLNQALRKDAGVLSLLSQGDVALSITLLRWERDGALRQQAAQLLQRFSDRPDVAAALREIAGAVGDDAVDARLAALEALRSAESPENVAVLLRVIHDEPDDRVRRKAVESLAILAPLGHKEEVVAALESAITREKNDDQRGLMLLSLIRVAPESASPVIKRILPGVEGARQRDMLTATSEMLDAGERDWLKIMLRIQARFQGK